MHAATVRRSHRQDAFTLIELLIALAVVAILAAALFPVIAQARDYRKVSCLSNERQFSEAYFLYAADHNGIATQTGEKLMAYVDRNSILPCPSHFLARANFLRVKGGGGIQPAVVYGDMTWHNGAIMVTAANAAIFWGSSWPSYSGDKISGMDSWYNGFNGSNYAKASDEYTGTNGQVTATTSYYGHFIDGSAAPKRAPSVSTIQSEVCKVIPASDLVANGYYAVYIDKPRPASAGYCAWHSYGSCSGVPVQFAFFFNLDGDPGCDPGDTSGLHSQGLAALANVSGHELSEARTDPRNGGWYDAGNNENGDKCAWTFGAPLVTFSNGTQWKIQGEWSNAAYNAGTGYPNSSGQLGCLSGQ
ncbi:MAG TPA: prepilin-type N-terminal cleavage/methylation domain-containing protein [Chthonomonadaceae bacterium]|nr:prepilin-type N-terminal cleavage/methylation domain-containing protein [Chthonomonadaceae bacterium]